MTTIGLLTNERNPAALDAARRLTALLLGRRDVRVLARASVAASVDGSLCCAATDAEIAKADFVVVFGGDGTILAAARLVAPHGTPLLSVHLGHFGFITEVAPDGILEAVELALSGQARVEERMMLRGVIARAHPAPPEGPVAGSDPAELLAMNDIVAASGSVRMTHIRTEIDGMILATYAADGVIVASPTGSTGYSLSAGGPLLHPEVPALVVTPICPHTLSARSLVLPDTHSVRLTVVGPARDTVIASVDGQIDIVLETGDSIVISRSPHNVRILTVGGPNFYQKIRSRWNFGERAPS
jgi:NAD+ kinase